MTICTICNCEFSLDDEGGIAGDFGILPMALCPTCLACMLDMFGQLRCSDCEFKDDDRTDD